MTQRALDLFSDSSMRQWVRRATRDDLLEWASWRQEKLPDKVALPRLRTAVLNILRSRDTREASELEDIRRRIWFTLSRHMPYSEYEVLWERIGAKRGVKLQVYELEDELYNRGLTIEA